MDKGAHFFKCDFQVHTPRDINWTGADATSEADRKAYAEELILACRKKGLGAIAITDHHDFAFFPFYVKNAALNELDDKGGSPIARNTHNRCISWNRIDAHRAELPSASYF